MPTRPKNARSRNATTKTESKPSSSEIQAPKGKLGVMIPGMGAVATTFVAGVEAVRKGIAKPIGSLTQMGTIRLGKRTDGALAQDQGICSAGGLERSGLYRLGHFRRRHVHGGVEGRRAGARLLDQIKPS